MMDKVWTFKVKVEQGYQFWQAAFDAEDDARAAIGKCCPDGKVIEGKQIKNTENLKKGQCHQLPVTGKIE